MGVIQRPRFQPESRFAPTAPNAFPILNNGIKRRRKPIVEKTADEIRTITETGELDADGKPIVQVHRLIRDNRHDPSAYDPIRAFAARECGVPYIEVGDGLRDIEAPVKILPPTVGDDGTPGSVYRLDEGAVESARRDIRQMIDNPPMLASTANGMLTQDSLETAVVASLAEVFVRAGAA